MGLSNSYQVFRISKSYSDVINDVSIWVSDLNFTQEELLFLNTLVKSDLFKAGTPNLFERLQLLLKEINEFNEWTELIKNKIEKYRNSVVETLDSDVFSLAENYLETYQSIEEELFEFNKKYKFFKAHLYEFLIEIIE